ncbi:ATP-dependent zinc protease family protein [Bythopirellula polymerisocia]|uniref:Retropepsin-like aspartic endopeptidase domain-containing protein n=1 Tax=Bythopirellula polymerisocia TaxID=2528003 RepID=A0A5C6CSK2_9BACT|nr:RimK/LysX family protein [Bythopirellula polymerisocia]TWU27492.1 hypothetical protein Pla144_22660 [Bythopirellula polymerisocia]
MDSAKSMTLKKRILRSAKTVSLTAIVGLGPFCWYAIAEETPPVRIAEKRIIGPTTIIAESKSELDFKARVDTGATTSSLHVEEWAIEDESPQMADNVGKKIRIRVKNHRDESQWIESRIEEIGTVKTSAVAEERYKVELTLCWNDVKKQVLVTLNDRSRMKYPMLLGRNFLQGDFVVDVDLKKQTHAEILQVLEKPALKHATTKAVLAESDQKAENLE